MDSTLTNAAVICFGESFWTATPAGAKADGSPLKIAYHLKKLGIHPLLITKVGIDEPGKRIIGFAEKHQLSTDFFQLDYNIATGSILPLPGSVAQLQPGYHNQAWDYIEWEEGFNRLFAKNAMIIHGSLCTRNHISGQTLYRCFETGARRVYHLDLHPPFYSRESIEYCLTGAFLLKLTIEELEIITGWFSRFKNPYERMSALQERFKIPYVLVSNGSGGALINASGTVFEHPGFFAGIVPGPALEDAFLAGAVYSLLSNEEARDIATYACALQSFTADLDENESNYDRSLIHQLLSKK